MTTAITSVRDGTASERARDELLDSLRANADYYPEWCELRLLDAHLPVIAADVGRDARVIELGDGGIKSRRLEIALAAARPRERVRTLVFFPHAPIDRLAPSETVRVLAKLGHVTGQDASLVIAADGTRDRAKLLAAYAGFAPRWDETRARVELHVAGDVVHVYKHSVLAMRGILVASGWDVVAVHAAPGHEVRLWRCVRR